MAAALSSHAALLRIAAQGIAATALLRVDKGQLTRRVG